MVPGESEVPGCWAPPPNRHLLLPGNTAPIQLYSSSPRALLADSLRVPVALSPVPNLCLSVNQFTRLSGLSAWGCMCVYIYPNSAAWFRAGLLCHMPVVPPWASCSTSLSFQILHCKIILAPSQDCWTNWIHSTGCPRPCLDPEAWHTGSTFHFFLQNVTVPFSVGTVWPQFGFQGFPEVMPLFEQDRPHDSTQRSLWTRSFSLDAFCKATGVSPHPGPGWHRWAQKALSSFSFFRTGSRSFPVN